MPDLERAEKEAYLDKMKLIPVSQRPYERFAAVGAENLTDTELIAIILRSGTKGKSALVLAQEVLAQGGGFNGLLSLLHTTKEELLTLEGVGEVKAAQLLCIAELSRRIAQTTAGQHLTFSEPAAIAGYFMEDMRHKERETTKIIMLNAKGRLIDAIDIAEGTVMFSCLDPREVFREALRHGAVSVCILHNHPSGDPTPSTEDIRSTRRMAAAGELIGIPVIDHIIIGDNKYKSFRELGIIAG